MIVLDQVQQGSVEWAELRLGIPTASRFDTILQPKRLKLSESRRPYMMELLEEWMLGRPADGYQSVEMWRGGELEARARRYYEFVHEGTARQVGFVYRDSERMVGCSPDWLLRDDAGDWTGGGEVKCPTAAGKHMGWMLADAMPDEHRMQVQGCLWVTGLPEWRFMSYHPDLPAVIHTVEPDPDVQSALDDAIPTFIEEMCHERDKLRERYPERFDQATGSGRHRAARAPG